MISGLVAQAALDVAVQAVVGTFSVPSSNHLEERRVALVQDLGEGRLPADQLARQAAQ